MDLSLDADLTFSVDVAGVPPVTGHLPSSGAGFELRRPGAVGAVASGRWKRTG